jgi:mRNA interferase RelE/StbE
VTFRVLIEKGALRDLKKLDRATAERIARKLQAVASHGYGFEPLTNIQYGWKIRIGDYRALCDIDFAESVIRVHVIGHRREVYR